MHLYVIELTNKKDNSKSSKYYICALGPDDAIPTLKKKRPKIYESWIVDKVKAVPNFLNSMS